MSIMSQDYLFFGLAVFLAVVAIAFVQQRLFYRQPDLDIDVQKNHKLLAFLFDDKVLLDATPDAVSMISPHLNHMSEFDAMLHVLCARFQQLRQELEKAIDGRSRVQNADDDQLWLIIERHGRRVRLTVHGETGAPANDTLDVIERDIRQSELLLLRDFTQHTPQIIWQEDLQGKLLWANHAYLTFSDRLRQQSRSDIAPWPAQPLLPELQTANIGRSATVRRISVSLPDQKAEQWFDVTSIRRGDHILHFANDANAIVRADQERRDYVHALSNTFAQLTTGLAIFNDKRELVTFNPALLELIGLPVEFLSSRPTIDAFLDRLREVRMLPEPVNYASWREQFAAMEQAAKDGQYSEIWNLPDDQTFRVRGGPQPKGAFALMFDDISAEVSLRQRFRSDIETGQAVLDTLPDAIAVFSSTGTLVMENKSYSELWNLGEEDCLAQQEIRSAIQIWQARCVTSDIWSDLRSFVHFLGPRKDWTSNIVLQDGRQMTCSAQAIAGGRTMIKFSILQATPALILGASRQAEKKRVSGKH